MSIGQRIWLCCLWIGPSGLGLAHHDHDLAVRVHGVRGPPLAPVEDVLVAVLVDRQADVGRVGAGDVGLGHREGRADLALEQRFEPAVLLLVGAELVQDLHVARVGGRAVAGLRGDRRAAEDLGEGCVVGVREARSVVGVGQEHVPEPGLTCLDLQFLHHGRVEVGVAGLESLLLVDLLGGVDVLVHERVQALDEIGAALAGLKVHRVLLGGDRALGSSPMSTDGASYRAAGVDYEVLDAGKRLAMARALATSPLMAGRGGRALDASRGEPAFVFELGGQTLAFVVEGLGHEVDDLASGARAAGRQPLRRRRLRHRRRDRQRPLLRGSSARSWSTPISRRAPRSGTPRRAAPRPWSRAGTGPALTPAARGEGGSLPRSRGCSPRATSSWREPRWARCPTAAGRSSARTSPRAMRSSWWRPAACTRTGRPSPG